MMSKTHLAVGLAAVLAAAPATVEGMCYALMGGAIGSLICDIDRADKKPTEDFKQGWITVTNDIPELKEYCQNIIDKIS